MSDLSTFGVISDLHLHNYTEFNHPVNEAGVTKRVMVLCEAINVAAKNVRYYGGKYLFIAGDVFHVRGKISPTVMNPLIKTLDDIATGYGMKVVIIPGNHDLETECSHAESSAVNILKSHGIDVYGVPTMYSLSADDAVYFIPWQQELEKLKLTLNALDKEMRSRVTAIMHAPINGVIKGLPETGLDPEWLRSLGYKSILSGHYHNHVDFGDNVYSIGAMAHNSFSDIDTTAGMVMHRAGIFSQINLNTPKFVEFDGINHEGNYVRVKLENHPQDEVDQLRTDLLAQGALGVKIINDKRAKTSVRAVTTAATPTLSASVDNYIMKEAFESDPLADKIRDAALKIVGAM